MAANRKLSTSMTVTQFENGYWYASELKKFAESIGIPSANKLRKDELEKGVVLFLESGKIQVPTKRALSRAGVKDYEKGLSLELPIVNYISNKETKSFIVREAERIAPEVKARSGVWYRLNRWREEQVTRGNAIRYRDLVTQYIKLNKTGGAFAKIPHGRYVNFLSEFLSHEKGATHEKAVSAWKELKKMDIPKDYGSWAKHQRGGANSRVETQ